MSRAAIFMHSVRTTLGLVGLLALALLAAWAGRAAASIDPQRHDERMRPRLIAPAAGERVQESAAIFAFERPRGASELRLLLMPRELDVTGWTGIPDLPGLISSDAARGALTLTEAGVTLSEESRWWWTVASRDAGGTWTFGEVRSFTAIPRFTNRVATSPYLMGGLIGRMTAIDLKEAQASGLRGPEGTPRIRLAAGYDFAPTSAAGVSQVPAELSMSRVPADQAAAGLQSYLVQFASPPGAEEWRAIAAAGGAVISYVPDQAYLVRMSAAARSALAASARAAWIGDWQPAYKLSARADRSSETISTFEALLFPDADGPGVSRALTATGAEVVRTSDNGINKLVRFRSSGVGLAAVAALTGVAWIEPLVPPQVDNDLAQWVVQSGVNGSRRVWDMGIRGAGQVVMTSDSGIHTAHDQFRDPLVPITTWGDYPTHRKVIAYKQGGTSSAIEFDDNSSASFHGTHTAGTLMGSDSAVGGISPRDGMAKDAKIYFMDVGGSALGTGLDPFADLNDLFLPPYLGNAGGAARISSNSWGSTVAGAYTLNSYEVDQFTWTHPDFYIGFSNGNSTTAGTVGSPATAKNCSGMGGTLNGTSEGSLYTTTSRGPCADGRRKPTFAAPGSSVTSAYGGSTNTYQPLSGTSMACPAGTGAVVLMRQYLTDGWYPTGLKVPANAFTPSAALLKAMAINSAVGPISGLNAPDNNIGWGRVCTDSVLYFSGDAKKLLLEDFTSGLTSGQYVEYQVNVIDSLMPLKVSLCWTDFPGTPAAATELVNNLDLTVTKGATSYKGNQFSLGASITGGSYDLKNVEEGVRIMVPSKGVWTVRVAAPSVPVGPQPFGLVITGGVGNGAGSLALDRASYGSSSTMQIKVIDTDAPASVNVTVASSTEPGGETVSIPGSNGVYSGTLPLAPALPAPADGVLQVSNGDALTATYTDASQSTSLTALAVVDFSTPVITNVHATSYGPVGTLITWNTDRNATSRVYYGTTAGLELGSVDSLGYVFAHKVLIPGVTAGQSYPYDVESVSLTGSSARDDRGGTHYRFTAKLTGDVLLLLGDPNFDRTVTWQLSLGNDGYDSDTWSGNLADNPPIGDLSGGLRSYEAIIWQCGPDEYPPVNDTQRTAIDSYLSGGGRLWILGHDLGWGLADPSSPGYSAARAAWLQGTLHANFVTDPATWNAESGVVSDPISGPFAGSPVAYQPFGSGQSGDEISANAGAGTSNIVWNDNFTPGANVLRWESNSSNGSAGTALWGGQPSRLVSEFLEFTAMRPPFSASDAVRDTVLDRTLTWLFGRDRPRVALSAPNGGENITTGTTSVTWTESVAGGLSVTNRTLEYSLDGGDSWSTVASGLGPSPYSWDLTSVPNSAHARVRLRIADSGSPVLHGSDASAADFAINRSGGDVEGPVVVSGSVAVSPNPVLRGTNATLTATVSDALTGGGTVSAAEWSFGISGPLPAGSGTPMTGTFGTTSVAVSLLLDTQSFVLGTQKLWVRGQDAAGNWGTASALTVQVNGTGAAGVTDQTTVTFLAQNAPNPAMAGGTTTIRFGLARGGAVALDVFDPQGRRVRRLASGAFPPGLHQAAWDGRDDGGERLGAGLYFYRLTTPDGRFEKRMALLP